MDIQIMLSRFDELWAREDVVGAFAELKHQLQHPQAGTWPSAIAIRCFRLGRYADAKAVIQQDPEYRSPSQVNFLFRLAFYSGKNEEAREILSAALQRNPGGIIGMGVVLPALQLGVSGWDKGLSVAPPRFSEAGNLARGSSALQEGRNRDAVALFRTAWDQHDSYKVYGLYIAEGLSTALERSGDLPQAAKVLEQASSERLQNPPQWLRNEALLSGVYRRLNRNSDARKVEDRLRKLLAFADADNPILQKLKAQ